MHQATRFQPAWDPDTRQVGIRGQTAQLLPPFLVKELIKTLLLGSGKCMVSLVIPSLLFLQRGILSASKTKQNKTTTTKSTTNKQTNKQKRTIQECRVASSDQDGKQRAQWEFSEDELSVLKRRGVFSGTRARSAHHTHALLQKPFNSLNIFHFYRRAEGG